MVTFLCAVFLLTFLSCEKFEIIIPKDGYDWPQNVRDYWPTNGWQTSPMESHNIDTVKMNLAHQFAEDDELSRALLVIKDGYLVFEKYYNDGGPEKSTNLWSVTKSFSSAVVGLIYDQDIITSTNLLMAELMPEYPEFDKITLHHVLTHTTGLSWAESGPLWVEWIFSDDWVRSALARSHVNEPGRKFYYSSGNSHFLTALVDSKIDISVGQLAKKHLFDSMGITFNIIDEDLQYNTWADYIKPANQTWRKDPNGIETASFGLYLTARDMAKFGFLYLNKGKWENQNLLSEEWVELSTKEHVFNIYGRYSYGYQWYITNVGGHAAFLASGFGGQIIGIVPSLDLVVVLKYDAENPVHPKPGTKHDDMHLFELVVNAIG